MQFVGGKKRQFKHFLPLIVPHIDRVYIEPFVGGCNSIDQVSNRYQKFGYDINPHLINMWKALQCGWIPPEYISKNEYIHIKENQQQYESHLVSFIGFCCSFNSKWFGGYTGNNRLASGKERNYYDQARNNLINQIDKIINIRFECKSYEAIDFNQFYNQKVVLYCDPPYKNAQDNYFESEFDHDFFWQWCRENSTVDKKIVFISEYSAPDDFISICQIPIKACISNSKKHRMHNEQLFVHESLRKIIP